VQTAGDSVMISESGEVGEGERMSVGTRSLGLTSLNEDGKPVRVSPMRRVMGVIARPISWRRICGAKEHAPGA